MIIPAWAAPLFPRCVGLAPNWQISSSQKCSKYSVSTCRLSSSAHGSRVVRFGRYFAALSALLISGAIVFVLVPSKRELIVRGKPVSEWALGLAGPAPTEPAKDVIKSFGSEAVPDLVRML